MDLICWFEGLVFFGLVMLIFVVGFGVFMFNFVMLVGGERI